MTGLRRHVPEIAIEWAIDAPEHRWQAIDGTLCFADISGFTALAERLTQRGRVGGEELVETLSRVFGAMLESARERDGMLLKFGGDALLFLFRGEGHAPRAASTAVEMRRALRRAAEIPTSVGRLRLSMSIGLHSGRLHFFLVGSSHRELVLAGSAVTRTVETEGAAEAGQIAVTAATAASLPPAAVRPREDGTLLLRWRRPHAAAALPRPEREIDPEILRGLFPHRLGEVLEPGPPEPEHRVGCIAFVRFSGTDALLEENGPDALAQALQTTLAAAQSALEEEGVTLLAVDVDRDGGKLFLGSGVPHASEDDEGRMLRALRRIADSDLPLPLQFGVNRGHVFAAEVGTARRAAYSAMGDTTNTAARICAKAPPGAIYAHPSVLDHSRTLFETEPAGPFTFKGKKTPQIVYAVGSERGTRAEETRGELALVGRGPELELLLAAADALRAGRGGVVSVSGATGLGKSRLLREALEGLRDIPVVALRAEPYGANSPYRIFRDPMRSLLGIARADAETMRAQLERGAARLDSDLVPLLALLGDVVHVEVEPSAVVAAIDTEFRPDRVADTVIQLLAAAHDGPVAFTVDDAQWVDEASAHLLECIARACEERGWLLLVARRDLDGGFEPSGGQGIALGPLDREAIVAIVVQSTASAPLRPHEIELVVDRAGGNPLFAEAIVQAARQAGSFDAVPDSLEAALAARVDALDPAIRRILRHASVLGRSFGRRNLEALLGDRLEVATLSRLTGFLEADGAERLRFRNGLVRDAVYEGLAFRLRRSLHLAAAETIEKLAADPNANADTLALHFSIAGDGERTWRYARLAGDRARHAAANAEAARLYEMALGATRRLPQVSDADRARVWTDLGDVRELAGMLDEALEAYRKATGASGDDPVARAHLLVKRAQARERLGAFKSALRELNRAYRLVEAVGSTAAAQARARIRCAAAVNRWTQEHLREALKEALEAVEEARRAGDRAMLAEALMVSDSLRIELAEEGAGERVREAITIFEELGNLRRQAMAWGNLGALKHFAGSWDEAWDLYSKAQEIYQRAGDVVSAALAAQFRGELRLNQGSLDEAETLLRDSIRVMRASGYADGAAYAEIHLARVLLERGALEEADSVLERVGAELRDLGQASSALEAAVVQAIVRVRRGDAAAALEGIDRSFRAAGEDAHRLRATVARGRAGALAALGRLDEAQQELRRGLGAAYEQSLPYEEALLRLLKAEVDRAARGEPDPDDEEAAAEILRGLGVHRPPRPLLSAASSGRLATS